MILQIFRARKWFCNRWPINARRLKRIHGRNMTPRVGLCHIFFLPSFRDKLMKYLYLPIRAHAREIARQRRSRKRVAKSCRRRRPAAKGKIKKLHFLRTSYFFDDTLARSFSIKVVIFTRFYLLHYTSVKFNIKNAHTRRLLAFFFFFKCLTAMR